MSLNFRIGLMLGVCTLLGMHSVLGGQSSANESKDIASLESLAGRWIDLRAELAAEKQAWMRQERKWNQEIALLEKEIATLGEARAQDESFLADREQEQADLLAEKEAATAALDDLEKAVAQHEANIRSFEILVPESLRTDLDTGFRALPRDDEAASRLGVIHRLQTVLALYTQIESLQNELHLVRELIPAPSGKREVDVLYLGLSRGFAVSSGSDWAAIGRPTEAGWQWEETIEEASRIRLAIDVKQREADVQLVPLLLGLSGEELP